MKATATDTGSHRVGKPRTLVDPEVVRVGEGRVMRCRCESGRHNRDTPQLRQVEDLHAVARGFAHDECVVAVDLYIAPVTVDGLCRQIAKVDWGRGVADVDERRPRASAHNDVLGAVERIGPAPSVGTRTAPNARHREIRMKVDVFASVNVRGPASTNCCLGGPGRDLLCNLVRIRRTQGPIRGTHPMAGDPCGCSRFHVVGEEN